MTDAEYEQIKAVLRAEAAQWFNNETITLLERFVAEADRARRPGHSIPTTRER